LDIRDLELILNLFKIASFTFDLEIQVLQILIKPGMKI